MEAEAEVEAEAEAALKSTASKTLLPTVHPLGVLYSAKRQWRGRRIEFISRSIRFPSYYQISNLFSPHQLFNLPHCQREEYLDSKEGEELPGGVIGKTTLGRHCSLVFTAESKMVGLLSLVM